MLIQYKYIYKALNELICLLTRFPTAAISNKQIKVRTLSAVVVNPVERIKEKAVNVAVKAAIDVSACKTS